MRRRFSFLLITIVIAANGAATCLYSSAGPGGRSGSTLAVPWNPLLEALAALLTVPIQTAGIADVRDIVFPTCLAAALLVIVLDDRARIRGADPSPKRQRGVRGPVACALGSDPGCTTAHVRNPAEQWLRGCAVCVAGLAALSAATNGSLGWSWGWLARFAMGAGWAVLICRTFSERMTRQVVRGLLALGLACLVLTIAHRADRGLAHFSWPIGPITITGALAATWAATAAGIALTLAAARRRTIDVLWCGLVCAVALYVLQQTGRRAPALGLLAGAAAITTLSLWFRFRARAVRFAVAAGAALSIAGGAWFVIGQATSPVREKSGPVALRFAYWKESAGLIAQRPILGFGPGTYVVHMTNRIAPRRGMSPHFFSGNIEPYAHNEWVQAAVELGLPAASAYLALPIGVLVIGMRRKRAAATASRLATAFDEEEEPRASARAAARLRETPRSVNGQPAPWNGNRHEAEDPTLPPTVHRALVIGLCAGLATLLVTELASITLRGPIMPVWYWSMLGLLGSLCGAPSRGSCSRTGHFGRESIRAAGLAVSALVCVLISVTEMVAARPVVAGEVGAGQLSRLFAEKTLTTRYESARHAVAKARASDDPANIQAVLEQCRDLYERVPGYSDVPALYAEMLALAGERSAARGVLEHAFEKRLNEFSPAANVLYAGLQPDDPVAQLRCVQRALRKTGLTPDLQAILAETLRHAPVRQILAREVPAARDAVRREDGPSEVRSVGAMLRIGVFAARQEGDDDAAIRDQRLAAGFYARLERENSIYRRAAGAEWDAFYRLAKMLYEADPANYRKAYEAILSAERFAVLGIQHEQVADPNPASGFVGGVVIPTELPARLRPLWRLSALLHVLAGRDDLLIGRIMSYLPPEAWGEDDVRRELLHLYQRACDDMSTLPPAKRPKHYQSICETAGRSFAPDS